MYATYSSMGSPNPTHHSILQAVRWKTEIFMWVKAGARSGGLCVHVCLHVRVRDTLCVNVWDEFKVILRILGIGNSVNDSGVAAH